MAAIYQSTCYGYRYGRQGLKVFLSWDQERKNVTTPAVEILCINVALAWGYELDRYLTKQKLVMYVKATINILVWIQEAYLWQKSKTQSINPFMHQKLYLSINQSINQPLNSGKIQLIEVLKIHVCV